MTLREIKEILEAEIIGDVEDLDLEIDRAHGADLLSDVLTFSKSDSLLLTGLTNPQVVRTARIADIRAICLVRGKRPQDETVELAEQEGIPLLWTRLHMYESCGLLYSRGLPGSPQAEE